MSLRKHLLKTNPFFYLMTVIFLGFWFFQYTYVLQAVPTAYAVTAPVSSPLVFDSFTDTAGKLLENHTSDSASQWRKHPLVTWGNAKITASNRVRPHTNSRSLYYSVASPSAATYDVTADLYVASNQGMAAVAARMVTNSDSYYYAGYENGKWGILRKMNGSTTYFGGTPAVLQVGSTYALKFEVRDAAKKLYVKGPTDTDYVLKATTFDNTLVQTGYAGIMLNPDLSTGNDSIGYHLDNFTVTQQ